MISDDRLAELSSLLEMALHAKEGHQDRLNIIRTFFALVLKEGITKRKSLTPYNVTL